MSSEDDRTGPGGVGRFLANLLRIRRVEFRIGEIPILLMPPLLERALGAPPATPGIWVEAFFAFFFMFAYGDMINCLADRDLDAKYKTHLSRAVYELGPGFVALQIAGSAAAALGIAIHLALSLHRWLLIPTVLIGLALGAMYSVEPIRLKARGLWHLICLWLIILFGPMLFLSLLLRPFPSPALILFAAAYATIQMGVILVNSAEDYPEDLEAGVRNTVVAYGLAPSIQLAVAMVGTGALGILGVLGALYYHFNAAPQFWLGLLPFVGAADFVLVDIGRLSRSIANVALPDQVAAVKEAAKRVPIWVTLVAWSAFLAVWVLYRISTGGWFA